MSYRWISIVLALAAPLALAQTPKTDFRFQFGSLPPVAGCIGVTPTDAYTAGKGYGFEPASHVTAWDRDVTSDQPIYFSIAEPEGNYRLTVTLGDAAAATSTTVKAELRRLMLENVATQPGEFVTRSFIVNVRRPEIPGGAHVRLKVPRETMQEAWAWDNKLTLEFIGSKPAVSSIQISKVDNLPTLFIIGDSTSTDQSREPYNSWGQMLTRFFTPEIAVANHGESGETTSSFLGENRWAKVLSIIKPGDYVIMQFGHNDEKDRGPNAGAFKNYKANLERFVKDTRDHGATPILVTPMHRRTFNDAGKIVNSHRDYPDAVRAVAREQNVALIDLTNMSQSLYEALGKQPSGVLFAGKDTTHHSDYGSYELAKCIVTGIRQDDLPLAKFLASDAPPFDPARPDAFDQFKIPAEPMVAATTRPAGS